MTYKYSIDHIPSYIQELPTMFFLSYLRLRFYIQLLTPSLRVIILRLHAWHNIWNIYWWSTSASSTTTGTKSIGQLCPRSTRIDHNHFEYAKELALMSNSNRCFSSDFWVMVAFHMTASFIKSQNKTPITLFSMSRSLQDPRLMFDHDRWLSKISGEVLQELKKERIRLDNNSVGLSPVMVLSYIDLPNDHLECKLLQQEFVVLDNQTWTLHPSQVQTQ